MTEKEKLINKTRKQLWDSLLEVYEKKAEKENVSNYEEVSVMELEDWTINNPDTSFRALPQLVESNPQLVCKALPAESAQLRLDSGKEEETIRNKKKRKREISSCKVSNKRPKVPQPSFKQNTCMKKDVIRKQRRTLKEKGTNRHFDNSLKQSVENKLLQNNVNSAKLAIKTSNSPRHKCDLKLRYFCETEKPNVRFDGRTFNCQLIFKVCECLESDIIF